MRGMVEGELSEPAALPPQFVRSPAPSARRGGLKVYAASCSASPAKQAEPVGGLGDRCFGRFGAEGELLGADEGDVVDAHEAEQDADVRLLPVHRRGRALAVEAGAALDHHRLLALHQPFRAVRGVAEGEAGAGDMVEPGS